MIGSVAGDRGRRSNYIYGATKGGLAHLVEGIAHKLAPLGARAVIIKPGFVDTPMTDAIANKGALWATPEAVAVVIVRAGEKGGPAIYAPGFWRGIMPGRPRAARTDLQQGQYLSTDLAFALGKTRQMS